MTSNDMAIGASTEGRSGEILQPGIKLILEIYSSLTPHRHQDKKIISRPAFRFSRQPCTPG